MNERIKELVLQSQLVYETTDGKVYNSWEDYVDLTEYVEKFAELIVKECLNQCYNRGMNDELYAGQLKAASYIEQHFGINTRT